jgi:hypothetical protein
MLIETKQLLRGLALLRTVWIFLLMLSLQGAALSAAGRSAEHGALLEGVSASARADCARGKGGDEAPSHGDLWKHCCLACSAGAVDDSAQPNVSAGDVLTFPPLAPATLGEGFSRTASFRIFERPRSGSPRSPPSVA